MFRVLAFATIAAISVSEPVYTQVVSSPACAEDVKSVKKVHEISDIDLVYQTGPTHKNQYIEIYRSPKNPEAGMFAIIFYNSNGCVDDIVYRDITGAFYFLEEGLNPN